jgi:glycosyltransferase involved in cell wall biosynthesis
MINTRISIVMPAYNAAAHLRDVCRRIPRELLDTIGYLYIVNDGSVDATGEVIDEFARENEKIKPIHFQTNSGYGAAVKEGLSYCKNDFCDVAVCLHADGQYPPESILNAVSVMRSGTIDILQGSRIASGTALSGGMPLYKFIANRSLTLLENIVFGLCMTDYHSGMIFYSRKALDILPFDRFSKSFDFDVEVIACARAQGLSIGEFPIPTHYGDEISHVRSIRYGMSVLHMLVKYLSGKYKRL